MARKSAQVASENRFGVKTLESVPTTPDVFRKNPIDSDLAQLSRVGTRLVRDSELCHFSWSKRQSRTKSDSRVNLALRHFSDHASETTTESKEVAASQLF